ncbi:MAG: class I SAM-dependent methyltransferase [Planctomycetota bacterium]|jgi:ubiquinone/menaquinone biosynthesis C-methylase UbiE
MNVVEAVHGRKVLGRRFRVLSEQVSQLIPPESSVLDIGCGSGDIDKLILERRKDVTIRGIDVLVRQDTAIEVTEYDGNTLPCDDNSYDAVIFIDVLHHTDNIERLLAEAGRVAGKCVILKF